MRFFIAILFCALGMAAYAQQITVKDSLSGDPLSGVIIFNESRSTFITTNAHGRADLDRFNAREILSFKHLGYGLKKLQKSAIAERESVLLSPQTEGLDEIVISASRFADVARKLPVRIRKIGDQEIAFTQAQTAADLLHNTGAVFVQKSQLGGGSPMIRGFATNRVLITVDGIRMNNAIFRGGNIQNVISIDPFTLDQVEVLYGPGTVIAGSDAIGGVMNFYTRELEELESAPETLQQTDYALRMATAATERTVHVSHKIVSPKISGLVSFSRMSLGDLKMGANGPDSYLRTFYVTSEAGIDEVVQNDQPQKQIGSAFDSYHFMAKARHRLSKEWYQQLGFFLNTTSDFGRYDRLIQTRNGQPRSAEWYYGPQQWFMAYYKLNRESEKARHQFSTAYQRFNESRFDRAFKDPVLNEAAEGVNVLNFSLDTERILSKSSLLRYGFALDQNLITSSAFSLNRQSLERNSIESRYPDQSGWGMWALYGSLQHAFSETFTLNAGMRYNQVNSTIDFSTNTITADFRLQEFETSALTYSLGLNYDPDHHWHVRVNLATGFRAPNIDDLSKVFDSEPGSVVVPNPSLASEKAITTEFGVRRRWGRKLWIDGSFFHSRLNDALIRRPFTFQGQSQLMYRGVLSDVLAIQNGASAEVLGAELGLYSHLSRHLSTRAFANYTRGIETDAAGIESYMRHAAPFFGLIQLRYLNGRFSAVADSQFNGAITHERLALSEQSKDFMYALDAQDRPYSPAWHTFNLRFNYEWRRWQLFLALENIANKRYRPYSSGIAAPGRQLVLGLQTRR
ncbi:MAG: hypothetical protein RLZZ242_787 [Bacteroidota bacterium]|jgi:hemoglobin/transferrin/lactoferrin receptor protein